MVLEIISETIMGLYWEKKNSDYGRSVLRRRVKSRLKYSYAFTVTFRKTIYSITAGAT